MSGWDVLLYVALPYAAIAAFFLGHFWRYRRDQYTWTSRSSQLMESRMLRIGSVVFHYGTFAAIGGHVLGLLIPASWTAAAGISDDAYHVVSAIGGITAGIAVIVGFAVLMYRRAKLPRVRNVTSRMDVAVMALLALGIVTGMAVTLLANLGAHIDYRATVGPWFRGLLVLDPEPALMSGVHWMLQLHVTLLWLLYALWPFSRLVHAWSVPVDWFRRSPILFRSRSRVPRTVAGRRAVDRPLTRSES